MSVARDPMDRDCVVATPNWEQFYKRLREADFVPGYEIQGLLGHGSFGLVYKARKASVGRPCAIKFLKVDDPATGQAVMRELTGLEHLAQLDHPNLVSIEDQGEVEGIPYIVMGYGGDETLATRLHEVSPLPVEEAVGLIAKVCSAVQALHDHGVIHFDIKPGNVFLRGSRPRLGDYGLSRLITQSRRTLSFGRGTPLYMAPELLERKGDERSDIYSLGVMFFECLAGEPPFKGETEWEVMKRHESAQITFPKAFPRPYRKVIEKAMAKDPDHRFQSAGELSRVLEEIWRGGSVTLAPVPRPASSRSWWRPGGASARAIPPPPPLPVKREVDRGERGFWAKVEFVLSLPGRILSGIFRYGFRLFGFAIELFILAFIVILLIKILSGIISALD